MTSQQAAAMLHAAGVTGDYQQLHYCGIGDAGDEGYTSAVVLLEAAGLEGTHHTERIGTDKEYDVMRFVTENGTIVVSAPNGSVQRTRRMVGLPADRLGCAMFDDRVSLTELGAQTIAGLRDRVSDETSNDPALD